MCRVSTFSDFGTFSTSKQLPLYPCRACMLIILNSKKGIDKQNSLPKSPGVAREIEFLRKDTPGCEWP